MKILLFLVQIALWLGSGMWLVSRFGVESVLLQILIFGITGMAAMILCTYIASKIGIVPPFRSLRDDEPLPGSGFYD